MHDFLPNLTGPARYPIMLLIFVTVVAATFSAGTTLLERLAVRRRLLQPDGSESSGEPSTRSLRGERADGAWVRTLQAIEARGVQLVDTDRKVADNLAAAGYTKKEAQQTYTLVRLALTLGLPLTFIAICSVVGTLPSLFKLYIICSVMAIIGLYGPKIYVSIKADRRRSEISNGFPDVLDLMLVCVEAGLSIDAAFNRVGSEVGLSHPLLSHMLAELSLELRAGRTKQEALHRFADRAGVEEIHQFTTLLVQSEKLGTSIAQTLRVFSGEMRERRRMRAEEKAHRLPVLLSIPLVACLLPAMVGVLMLPAGIRVVRILLPALANHAHR
jgi:tight adherence protein C